MAESRGRPRNFDPEQVLNAATYVFWARGFEGTSINDLVDATGLNKPSLYAAFGDKEALYNTVVERYAKALLHRKREILASRSDVWQALEAMLRASAAALTNPALPGGCLVVTGLADCGTPNIPLNTERVLRESLERTEAALRERLEQAARDGQIPSGLRIEALAGSMSTFMAGMAIRTKSGADRASLDEAVDALVAMWPRSSVPGVEPSIDFIPAMPTAADRPRL